MATATRRGTQMRPWEYEAAFDPAARKRSKALRVDVDVIRNIKARLGEALTASAIFMEPLVEKDRARKPFEVEEVMLAVDEMGEMKQEPLRVAEGSMRAVILRNQKRKTTSRARKLPAELEKRLLVSRQLIEMARGNFTFRKYEVRELLGASAQVPGHVEAATWDAQDFVMGRHSLGMTQARSAWTEMFYGLQGVKPLEMRLDAAASKDFVRIIGDDENKYTLEADYLAEQRSMPVVIIDSQGLKVYSVYPAKIAPMLGRSVALEPGKLRRQWHHIQRAEKAGVALGTLTNAQSERVGEILEKEGRQSVSYLTKRVLIEDYYREQYDIDLSFLSHAQMDRAADIIAAEGIVDPRALAAGAGWKQYESPYATNPQGARADRAEHEAIWSLKF